MTRRDDVQVFLRDRGLADELVEAGAEGLVARWEQAARDAERECYPFGVEDWLNDLDGRQLIHGLGAALPGAFASALLARLEDADARIRSVAEVSLECMWGAGLAKRLRWSAKREWWYWLRPRKVNEDFEGGA